MAGGETLPGVRRLVMLEGLGLSGRGEDCLGPVPYSGAGFLGRVTFRSPAVSYVQTFVQR